jgi:DNA invertase Pin-like site-specific DNA recombinase
MQVPTRAAVYSRISSDPDNGELGVLRQEQDCFALIAAEGWRALPSAFRDNDISASTMRGGRRPGFESLLSAVESGLVDVIVTYSASRLTRRPAEYERLIALAERWGVRFETIVSGPVNLTTADGRALARILAAIDAAEAERISERIRRALKQKRELGRWQGVCPYAYDVVVTTQGRHLRLDPVRAERVRQAANQLLSGVTQAEICARWNAAGWRTRQGKKWYSSAVRQMLLSPTLAGLRLVDGELVQGSWEPVVDRTTWDRLQRYFRDPSRNYRRYASAERHPLAGLILCGSCKHEMSWHPVKGSDTFKCSTRKSGACKVITTIRSFDLERYLLDLVRETPAEALRVPPTPEIVRARERLLVLARGLQLVQDRYYADEMEREVFLEAVVSHRESLRLSRAGFASLATRTRSTMGSSAMPSQQDSFGARRECLHWHFESVEILPHPSGTRQPPTDWERRAERLSQRLVITWHPATSGVSWPLRPASQALSQ